MSLTSSHLEWLHENNLPTYLYSDFASILNSNYIPYLERSVKLNLKNCNIVNQTRYSINVKNSTENIAKRSLNLFLQYTNASKEELELNLKTWYFPHLQHDWYIGIDNNVHKTGVDYHGKYIVGISYVNFNFCHRKYNVFETPNWCLPLQEYLCFYKNSINEQIYSAIEHTIQETIKLNDSYIYIKQDDAGIVWHFNCKQLEYPKFSFLLNSRFNEKFTWFSFDSNLTHLTLYIRPNFLLVD